MDKDHEQELEDSDDVSDISFIDNSAYVQKIMLTLVTVTVKFLSSINKLCQLVPRVMTIKMSEEQVWLWVAWQRWRKSYVCELMQNIHN